MDNKISGSRRNLIGWFYVVVQFILIALLVLLPGNNDWATQSWILWVGRILTIAGCTVMGIAALGLGSSLTPTPVPRKHSQLKTGGLYRFMRHPIYSGVLLTVTGLTLTSSSWTHAGIALATAIFFNQKAKWEEIQLRKKYGDYQRYMEQTPRFIPWRLLRR